MREEECHNNLVRISKIFKKERVGFSWTLHDHIKYYFHIQTNVLPYQAVVLILFANWKMVEVLNS